ncbi:MAG: hypothetical protein KDA93_24075 [Planctomycetaceae bacterium]|nr:hypothetical protein [Planctomycetaceae bacterium]
MKYALVVSGILGGIALAAPMLVVMGFVLLIIPGVILLAAPTVFVYLAMTALIRKRLSGEPGLISTIVAMGISLLIGWIVMQPFHAAESAKYQASLSPDITSAEPIQLHGHVRIEMDHRRGEPECDSLCAAMLDLPAVESVTVESSRFTKDGKVSRRAAFELVSKTGHPDPGLFPIEPGNILREDPRFRGTFRGREVIAAAKAVEAGWALRLAGDQRIVPSKPVAGEEADWLIRLNISREPAEPKIRRVEVVDGEGTVRFRKTHVEHLIPARMFYFGFDVHMGSGTVAGASFHVGRQKRETSHLWLDLEPTLLGAIELSDPAADDTLLTRLRREVELTLDDPDASPARLDLTRRWLALFFFDAEETDAPLIARILADNRIHDIIEPLDNVYGKADVPIELKVAYAQRILMEHSTKQDRTQLASALAAMPPETFAEPHEAHLAIWRNVEVCHEAAPFIARITDLSPELAIPLLLNLLDESVRIEPEFEQRKLIENIQDCFAELGPEASIAVPELRQRFQSETSPIFRNRASLDEWRFVFARLGVPLDDLPFSEKERRQPHTWLDNTKQRIEIRLQRYERRHAG